MLRIFILLISAMFVFHYSYSQKVENIFIDALINNAENISDFVDKDELIRSECLGINYTGIENKWLISYDIPDEIKQGFRDGKFNYTLQTQQLEGGFSVVTLAVGSPLYLHKFYFLNDMFVPPSRYFTRNWENKQSKYFIFRISEPKYFNDYCIKRLDDFVDSLCTLLEIEPGRKKLLEKEKIYYTFCVDENEVEKITGYKSKGMSVLAYDEVITAYQTHFHEVAHLLINFKLQNLGLYTLPFFMEGFAVAVGGRGGLAPRVVTDLGYFLQKTGFLTYDSILTYESFFSQDANMTYAVSGLYNSFLLQELGRIKYIELYRSVNGSLDYLKSNLTENFVIPDDNKFNKFLGQYDKLKIMYIDEYDTLKPSFLLMQVGGGMDFVNEYIKFFINGSLFWGFEEDSIYYNENYISRICQQSNFRDKVPSYYIKSDSVSVHIYKLLNDELIYSYNKQLSLLQKNIPFNSGFNSFFIKSRLFEGDFEKGFYIRDGKLKY